ncbi:hypothetical protein EVB68_035 [Rhizobium phage RHph_Y2_6]|uniref:Uncharacterized protein n=1 Tax=Rhizobium phage RHph_Y2_6 TaxID=2509576 RepID=A0A7S5QZC8_9CAUD|nr:hypothetical protein PP748_gp035 [Rhizobium phage RHph_Y2_6]QIG68772.1 hypothetical protein EVB68_035 [Rhizobium phage RHph_Y2_6]
MSVTFLRVVETIRNSELGELTGKQMMDLAFVVHREQEDFRRIWIDSFRKACTEEQWKEIALKLPNGLFV